MQRRAGSRFQLSGQGDQAFEHLGEQKLDDVMVFAGGIIPDQDIPRLKEIGVAEIFRPGSSLEEIVSFVRSHVRPPIGT